MSTASFKLPDGVKALAAAERRGVSTHALTVNAIRLAAQAAQKRTEFVADKQAARVEAPSCGQRALPPMSSRPI